MSAVTLPKKLFGDHCQPPCTSLTMFDDSVERRPDRAGGPVGRLEALVREARERRLGVVQQVGLAEEPLPAVAAASGGACRVRLKSMRVVGAY